MFQRSPRLCRCPSAMSGAGKIATPKSQAQKATKEAEPTRKVSGYRPPSIDSRANWRNISITLIEPCDRRFECNSLVSPTIKPLLILSAHEAYPVPDTESEQAGRDIREELKGRAACRPSALEQSCPRLPLRYCVQLCMTNIDQPRPIPEPYDLASFSRRGERYSRVN